MAHDDLRDGIAGHRKDDAKVRESTGVPLS